MKLKKIASLMLAGVMAVSMLAGCSNKGGASSEGQNDEPTVSMPLLLSLPWTRIPQRMLLSLRMLACRLRPISWLLLLRAVWAM